MFPMLACFHSSPRAGKFLFWFLVACDHGRDAFKICQKGNIELPVAVLSCVASVFVGSSILAFWRREKWGERKLFCARPNFRAFKKQKRLQSCGSPTETLATQASCRPCSQTSVLKMTCRLFIEDLHFKICFRHATGVISLKSVRST